MTGFLSDLRSALRSLARSPATVALVTLTLGLGIAAATVIFSAVEGVLINPIRLDDADRYVSVYRAQTGRSELLATPPAELVELWRDAASFEQLEPTRTTGVMVTGLGPARTAAAMRISSTFDELLGLAPVLGRTFQAEETVPGGPDVVVLSYGYWRRTFGGRADVLGETITLDGRPHEVVGVVPAGFTRPASLLSEIDVWLPDRGAEDRGGGGLTGKLAEGVSRERAEAELTTLMAGHPLAERWTPRVLGIGSFVGNATRSALWLLMGAVGVLLLIATMNVANLLVSRAHTRTRETAVRAALGASRGRIARQLLFESLALGVVAGLAGVLMAQWGLAGLQALRPGALDVLDRVTLNATVLAFAAGVAMATSLLFGLGPAIHGASATGLATLRSGQRTAGGTGTRRFRLGLVVAEVALSAMLLVGAGLLARTVANLYRIDPGFRPEGVIRADLDIPRWKYEDRAAREALATELAERLRAVPGADQIVASVGAPPRSGVYFGALEIEGRDIDAAAGVLYGGSVGPGHFELLEQAIVEGRGFSPGESRSGAGYVLGRTTARTFWGDDSPIGSRIRLSDGEEWSPVVGVVEDVAINGLGRPSELQLYTPAEPWMASSWLIRAERAPEAVAAAVRQAIHEVDLDLIVGVSLVTDDLRASVGRQRFVMVLLLAFAAVATVLAAIGFYGVLSHLVTQRRREIGIRVSLGAGRRSVIGMIVTQGGAASVLGILIGLPAAFAGSTLVAGQLHGVGRGDLATYGAAGVLLLATGLLASWLPARRALAVDPMEVIREE